MRPIRISWHPLAGAAWFGFLFLVAAITKSTTCVVVEAIGWLLGGIRIVKV